MAASAAGSTGRVFISYRRDDTAYPAGWLYDRLASQYGSGQVFKDVDSIDLGDDFVQAITTAVGSCDVLLALIGKQWLTLTDQSGQRRLDDPDDFVRLEIEAALTRDVRVIPILTDGARMPRVDELPDSLVSLGRRQALELNPNRFEYDTGRLLKVLDTAVADVRTAEDGEAATATTISVQAGPNAAEPTPAPTRDPHDILDGADTRTPQPAARPLPESTSTPKDSRADRGRASRDDSPTQRSRTLRRVLMIAIPLVAVLASYLLTQFVLNHGDARSSATGEVTAEAPWRLVIRNDGSASNGCTVTLVNRDSGETWSNRYAVYDTASFLMPQGGTFRWSVESGCTVVSRPGPGSLRMGTVVDGVGTSDAFKPPAVIVVSLKDFRSNYRCRLELRDVATGAELDIGELDAQHKQVTLNPKGRPLVYLINDLCAVEVSAG